MNTPAFTHIYIAGCGAVGSLLAAGAARADLSYAMIPRRPVAGSIQVLSESGDVTLTSFAALPANTSADDLLILPLKAYQLEHALQDWRSCLCSETPVVLLHNGMGGYETARALLPASQPIYVATTSHGALKSDAQTVMHTGYGHTMLGRLDQVRLPAEDTRIFDALSTLLPPVTWRHDMQAALWHKLAINAAINPLTALNGIANGGLLYAGYRQQLRDLCSETVAVAAAYDVIFNTTQLLHDVLDVAARTAKNFSSMHQDYRQGRETEIDAINGYIVAMGKKKGIDAPRHASLVKQIKQRR